MDHLAQQYHVEDVGRILLQAQDDLRSMREKVLSSNNVDVDSINAILERAETDLRAKAEIVLNGVVNNSMKTLPVIDAPGGQTSLSKFSSKLARQRELAQSFSRESTFEEIETPALNPRQSIASSLRQHLGQPVVPMERDRPPGQRPIGRAVKIGRLIKRKVTKPNRLLPKMNRVDPLAPPPELQEEDARGGVLNLVNRGFIPSSVDLSRAFTHGDGIIQNSKLRIYDRSEQPVKCQPYINTSGFNMASLKFDLTPMPVEDELPMHPTRPLPAKRNPAQIQIAFPGGKEEPVPDVAPDDENRDDDAEAADTIDELRKNVEKIRGYNELLDTYSLHQFIIRKGETLTETPEFISFKRITEDLWGSVAAAIRGLETMLVNYSVPLAYIDGQKLLKIAAMEGSTRSQAELLSCILNVDEVTMLMRRPGQRFKGGDGRGAAAVLIQSVFRMHLTRRRLKQHHGHAYASLIQRIYRTYKCVKEAQVKLRLAREADAHVWEAQMSAFHANWDKIKMQRRVVVHVPSFSAEERTRLNMDNFAIRQNLQLARLCAIADPNVDVIYVSPFELSADIQKYMTRLLQLGGVADPHSRVRMLHPENAERFPEHFSLATVLLYSPHCLKKIKRYVRGKEAYIVAGTVGPEDKRLAIRLQLPLLGMDPDRALLYGTRSGAKRLFTQADVNLPIGAHDIYDEDELILSLAKLTAAHLHQGVWLVKLDADPTDTGIASIDMHALECVVKVRAEKRAMKNDEYYSQPNVKEGIVRAIVAELTEQFHHLITPCFPDIYPTWHHMRPVVNRFGAVIEAQRRACRSSGAYPAKVLARIRANVFIEPSGGVHITSAQDQIFHSKNKHQSVGAVFPPSAVPFPAIRGASVAIAQTMFASGIIGYASIDYVAFLEVKTVNGKAGPPRQRLWALQLLPGLTHTAISFVLFTFLSCAQLDPATGRSFLPLPVAANPATATAAPLTESQAAVEKILGQSPRATAVGPERAYIVHEYIFHPNMATLQYAVFFNTCRVHGVSFDLQKSIGAAFILADSLTAGVVGLLCIGESDKEAVRLTRAALELIGDQVGVQAVPDALTGERVGNFAAVLGAIRSRHDDAVKKAKKSRNTGAIA
ncbi:hypothetical protein ACHHYP_00632 [Achlya hypogyna]|uniref:IQCH-like ATP-grasp domain-containing protein n=1 Tax=Achlya hypogyna TaxID=1202772 RepID=A0A1V9ZAI1_ACHHY|nr:hypothetical protein ACHHYP_00632 [Achlya hypogyna]